MKKNLLLSTLLLALCAGVWFDAQTMKRKRKEEETKKTSSFEKAFEGISDFFSDFCGGGQDKNEEESTEGPTTKKRKFKQQKPEKTTTPPSNPLEIVIKLNPNLHKEGKVLRKFKNLDEAYTAYSCGKCKCTKCFWGHFMNQKQNSVDCLKKYVEFEDISIKEDNNTTKTNATNLSPTTSKTLEAFKKAVTRWSKALARVKQKYSFSEKNGSQKDFSFGGFSFLEQYGSQEEFSIATELNAIYEKHKDDSPSHLIPLSKETAPKLYNNLEKIKHIPIPIPPIFLTDGDCEFAFKQIRLGIKRIENLSNAEIIFIIMHEHGHVYAKTMNFTLNKDNGDETHLNTIFCLKPNQQEKQYLSYLNERIGERMADMYAIDQTKNPQALITGFLKYPTPKTGNDSSHPSNYERIAYALSQIK